MTATLPDSPIEALLQVPLGCYTIEALDAIYSQAKALSGGGIVLFDLGRDTLTAINEDAETIAEALGFVSLIPAGAERHQLLLTRKDIERTLRILTNYGQGDVWIYSAADGSLRSDNRGEIDWSDSNSLRQLNRKS